MIKPVSMGNYPAERQEHRRVLFYPQWNNILGIRETPVLLSQLMWSADSRCL